MRAAFTKPRCRAPRTRLVCTHNSAPDVDNHPFKCDPLRLVHINMAILLAAAVLALFASPVTANAPEIATKNGHILAKTGGELQDGMCGRIGWRGVAWREGWGRPWSTTRGVW